MTNYRLPGRASAATSLGADLNYKGKVLQLQFTVEDQGVFTVPWSASVIYRRSSDQWPEHVCAENPGRSPGTPTAAKSTVDQVVAPITVELLRVPRSRISPGF